MNQGYFPLNKFTDTSIYVGYDTFMLNGIQNI